MPFAGALSLDATSASYHNNLGVALLRGDCWKMRSKRSIKPSLSGPATPTPLQTWGSSKEN